MIGNEREYLAAKRELVKLRAVQRKINEMIRTLEVENPVGLSDSIDAIVSASAELIAEYEKLRYGEFPDLNVLVDIGRLAEVLTRARIATGWSWAEFGRRTGHLPQNAARNEDSNYACVKLSTLQRIAEVLAEDLKKRNSEFNIRLYETYRQSREE